MRFIFSLFLLSLFSFSDSQAANSKFLTDLNQIFALEEPRPLFFSLQKLNYSNLVKIPDSYIRGENSPYSFLSFLEKEFDGSEFKMGSLLRDYGTHKSYYATYMSEGLKISATFHVPQGEGPFPVLILNHGYFPPNEYTNGYGFGREQKYFAQKGYAVLHTDYRGYGYSDSVEENDPGARIWGNSGYATDSVNAVLALREANLDYLDMDRVGVFGHSLGGGVTLSAVMARPDLFRAGVLWGPVSSNYYDNFIKWRKDELTEDQKKIFEANFGPVEEPSSFLALSNQPYFDRLSVPLLIQHGTKDESCDIAWSRETVKRIRSEGKAIDYLEYEGYPHVFWNEKWDKAILDSLDFFDLHLKSL